MDPAAPNPWRPARLRRLARGPAGVCAGLLALLFAGSPARGAPGASSWVRLGPDGRLAYRTTPAGDRIMDFSSAGYAGGGVALPDVPVRRTVNPSGSGDDTAAIQAAIDAVAALPLVDGFRGAILLGPGKFTCAGSLTIAASGLVLRGSGSGLGPAGPVTTLRMAGRKHEAIVIGGSRRRAAPAGPGPATSITAAYVPAGATEFEVADAAGFAAGDRIELARPTAPAWVAFMRMDQLRRDGKAQTWIARSRGEVMERSVTAISGRRISVDVPLADSFDARYLDPPGVAVRLAPPGAAVSEIGVEHLHLQCPPLEIAYGEAPYSAIRVGGDDCWVRDVYCEETMNTTTLAGTRLTMEGVVVTHTFPNLGASKPTDFSIEGSQILIDRCRITGDNEYFVWTASLAPGPNVILNCTFSGLGSFVQPHERWSTGLLVDNCRVPDGGIDFMNRGVGGSGHGWTMGWGVAWNCLAKRYIIQNPPGACNWAVGCIGARVQTPAFFQSGPVEPEGVFDSPGVPVAPASLYLAQLAERLGPGALAAIGYPADPGAALADPAVHRTPEYAADIDPVLGPDLALHRPVNTSSVRGATREFGGEKAVDANPATAWATPDGAVPATLEVDTEGPLEVNAVAIEEAPGSGVQAYTVEGQVDSDWKLLSEGTTIGPHRVDRFPAVTVWKVRLTIRRAQPYAAIRKFGIYRAGGAGRLSALYHVGFWVRDIVKSRAFYEDYLGFAEPYVLNNPAGALQMVVIKVNEGQSIYLFPNPARILPNGDNLDHLGLVTDGAAALHDRLAARGIAVSPVHPARVGDLIFGLKDPDGRPYEVTEFEPGGQLMKHQGQGLPAGRISARLESATISARDLKASLGYYRDQLGFVETGRRGGGAAGPAEVELRVPDGTSGIVLQLAAGPPGTGPARAVPDFCLEVPDLDQAIAILNERAARGGFPRPGPVSLGPRGRRQTNCVDPDGTRVVLRENR